MTQEQADQGQALALEHSSLLTQIKAISKINDADQYNQVVAWRAVLMPGSSILLDSTMSELQRRADTTKL